MNSATDLVVPRMLALQRLAKMLKKLDLSWKVIETTARVVSPPESTGFIANLQHTRQAFSQLSAEMVEQIASTHLANCRHDLASRAQVTIDILVRNLFERTADVGFIATDGPLVDFVLAPSEQGRAKLHARLGEYRAKYTVYEDILVLNGHAEVLLSLKPRPTGAPFAPNWWARAQANQGYVESYGPSPLFAAEGAVLVYANGIADSSGATCGAVVLKFDLASEVASIFKSLAHDRMALLLLDPAGRVVASSAPDAFPSASSPQIPAVDHAAPPMLLQHQGVDYLFAHCSTRGYQGYMGPGWTAVALVPLDEAFGQVEPAVPGAGTHLVNAPPEVELDNPQLQQIVARARDIETDLSRVIWNGKIAGSDARGGAALGPVFAEIGRTSQQTIAVFDGAIRELKALLLVGRRAELAAHAALAVDIMDRNLYERANDCRWWALSEEFATLLQALDEAPSDEAVRRASEILAHLNSLYTVYRRVALFDRRGRILAVSRDPETLARDASIPADLLQRTLALKSTQSYAVSDMQPHALADGAATYLYCAPIHKGTGVACLGGIALAFNCAEELAAMLRDSLPAGIEASAFFVNASGTVLSSTRGDVLPGDAPEFLSAASGVGGIAEGETIVRYDGQPFLMGSAASKGYREFKVLDGYRDDVQAVLMAPVGRSQPPMTARNLPKRRLAAAGAPRKYGVVQCGRMLLALGSDQVVEAVTASHMNAPQVGSGCAGMLQYQRGGKALVIPAFDTCKLIGQSPIAAPELAVAVIVRNGDQRVALLVDRLVDVIECDHVDPPPGGLNPDAPWISGFLHDQQPLTEPVFTLNAHALQLGWLELTAVT